MISGLNNSIRDTQNSLSITTYQNFKTERNGGKTAFSFISAKIFVGFH
jgi:hypothetical protein